MYDEWHDRSSVWTPMNCSGNKNWTSNLSPTYVTPAWEHWDRANLYLQVLEESFLTVSSAQIESWTGHIFEQGRLHDFASKEVAGSAQNCRDRLSKLDRQRNHACQKYRSPLERPVDNYVRGLFQVIETLMMR